MDKIIRKGFIAEGIGDALGNFNLTKYIKELIAKFAGPKYKVYTALISQSGETAPTVVVLENTLGVELIPQRTGVGVYRLKATGYFTGKNVGCTIGQNMANGSYSIIYNMEDGNHIYIQTNWDSSGLPPTDGALYKNLIEIRVYE